MSKEPNTKQVEKDNTTSISSNEVQKKEVKKEVSGVEPSKKKFKDKKRPMRVIRIEGNIAKVEVLKPDSRIKRDEFKKHEIKQEINKEIKKEIIKKEEEDEPQVSQYIETTKKVKKEEKKESKPNTKPIRKITRENKEKKRETKIIDHRPDEETLKKIKEDLAKTPLFTMKKLPEDEKQKQKIEKMRKKILSMAEHCPEKVLSSEELLERRKKKNADELTRTIFVGNISFESTEEALLKKMQELGEVDYCKLCRIKENGKSKGTAFVCFKTAEIRDKVLKDAYAFIDTKESNVVFENRRLVLQKAISRDNISVVSLFKKKNADFDITKKELIDVGQKTKEEYLQLGLTPLETKMRLKSQMERNRKLKNPNFKINPLRVVVRNVPRAVTNDELRSLAKTFVKNGRISDIKSVEGDEGKLVGYRFIRFTNEMDARNFIEGVNETIRFKQRKRIMCEYSIDDMLKLHKFEIAVKQRKADFERVKKLQKGKEMPFRQVRFSIIPSKQELKKDWKTKKMVIKNKRHTPKGVEQVKNFRQKKDILI
ncbi:RNA-binding protein, putative [Entamoeba invadens IP1]|uniref:RNA-binding protein, putative n=1 Tax=Entamoeba invadens IP1 TaxID=370355 RepID=UPI0002C3F0FE|nr:RNA-binding protein, putative [Entamoeba invadens IP1]ELP93959.1 RNA-binding protein, putative [Entamoeba invadens IP1]|eukprot:XP_004260730.1 RNA-binding protein, putative [Entamoeba invadens IP1]